MIDQAVRMRPAVLLESVRRALRVRVADTILSAQTGDAANESLPLIGGAETDRKLVNG